MQGLFGAALASVFMLILPLSGCASPPPAVTSSDLRWTDNANILRRVEGSYHYLNLDDEGLRGTETFALTVHPSGRKTMTASTNIFSRDVHVTSILTADATFRPIDAFVAIWTQGRLRGQGHYRVEGDMLSVETRSEAGALSEELSVPHHMSLITHPIALDGWHFWYVEPGDPVEGLVYYIDGSAEFDKPMGGRLMSVTLTPLGTRTLNVPAGTFEAEGFAIDDHSEIWIATEDRLVVEYIWRDLNRRYVLATLETSS